MTGSSLPEITVDFSNQSLVLLNICLGIIMFGIALGINPRDFKFVLKHPKGALTGILSQFLLLPLFTFLLILVLKPAPALALGMILVAACPGGNISNFISSVSGANVALSVSLTAFSTLLTPVFTPLNFEIWSQALPETSMYLQTFRLNFFNLFTTVVLLLVIPLLLGLWVQLKLPKLSNSIEKPIRIISFLMLIGFIGFALKNNISVFLNHLHIVFLLVLVHNAVAFILGYFAGKTAKLSIADSRTISIETGIQNSGLGLVIIFTFFQGNGGMALVAAWWGVWHIVAGLALSYFFKRHDKRKEFLAIKN